MLKCGMKDMKHDDEFASALWIHLSIFALVAL